MTSDSPNESGSAAVEPQSPSQANKAMLAEKVASALNLPRQKANVALDGVLESIVLLLQERGKVAIKGFGTFERKIRKGRRYKLPTTGEYVFKEDKEVVVFKPADGLVQKTQSAASESSD